MYVVIHETEDGLIVESMSKDTLLNRITPDVNGEIYYGPRPIRFLDTIPGGGIWKSGSIDYKVCELLILDAEIKIPQAVNVVKKFEI